MKQESSFAIHLECYIYHHSSPACWGVSLSAGFTSSVHTHTHTIFFPPITDVMMGGEVMRRPSTSTLPPSLPPSPTGQRATPRTWAQSKVVQSLWMRLVVPGQSCRAACVFRMGDLATKVFGTPVQIRTMACKTHIQAHLLLFLFFSFFLIENKDSDISTSTEPSQTPNSQAYWKQYGGRTTPKLTAFRSIGGLRRLKPFQHDSWLLLIFNKSCLEDIIHLTFILFLLLHLFLNYKCMCF